MNKLLAGIAVALSLLSVLLAIQSQAFSYVDAGGPKLRMLIAGSGSPTVVFETGAGGSLERWGRVPFETSKFAKTISYDRAGNGLSEKSAGPRDGKQIATELHTALQNANASPPYILVGHSIGGPYIRVFAGLYPNEVAGMVLVDPSLDPNPEEMIAQNEEYGFGPSGQAEPIPDNIPANTRDEIDSKAATFAQAYENPVPANIPVFLIHAMHAWPPGIPFWSKELEESQNVHRVRAPVRLKLHKEWVDKTPGAELIIAENSGHMVAFDEPELVIRTIRQAIDKTKSRQIPQVER